MAACWGLHKKGNPYDGLLRALTTAAETRHEQERLQGAFVKRGNFHEDLWGVCLWACEVGAVCVVVERRSLCCDLRTAGTQRAAHAQPSEHTQPTAHAALLAARTHSPQGPQQPLGCQGERHSQKLHGALVKRGSLHEGLQGAFMTSKSPHVKNMRSWRPSKGSMEDWKACGSLAKQKTNLHEGLQGA